MAPIKEWTVEAIPKTDEGVSFYLAHYKPFRLLALQRDPLAFGSTLAREQAFDDERWRQRLLSAHATTFIARESSEPDHILSSMTLVKSEMVDETLKDQLGITGPVLQWELNGVFTHPVARGRGWAARVMEAARHFAIKEAIEKSSHCLLTTVVYADNLAAGLWYARMGFEIYADGDDQGRPTCKMKLFLEGRA